MKNNKTMIKMMIVNFKEHFYDDDDEDFENVAHEDQHVKDKGWQW